MGNFTGQTYIIDQTIPTATTLATSGTGITNGNGDLNVGKTVTFTATFNEVVLVALNGGTMSLGLNNGGQAAYSGGSGTNILTFTYTVAAGQDTNDVQVTSVNRTGSTLPTITDAGGNVAVYTSLQQTPQAFCRSTPRHVRVAN